MMLARLVIRALMRVVGPETAHDAAIAAVRVGHALSLDRSWQALCRPAVSIRSRVMGITFPSPIILAAGFDKDGVAVEPLFRLGFGAIEVGTVTAHPQPGNLKPRLFRLPADRAIVNRMGFNNRGARSLAGRLRVVRARTRSAGEPRPIVGVNIGKNRRVALGDAPAAYAQAVRLVADTADYLVVNVSSPNTPGLRALQRPERLRGVLEAVLAAAGDLPVLVKVSPDETDAALTGIARVAVEVGIAGIIATNTTVRRQGLGLRSADADVAAAGEGGLSGAPLRARALRVLDLLAAETRGRLVLVSSGGVESAADVWNRLLAGASLVQVYTGLVYEGPLWIRHLNRGLERRLAESPVHTISEAVGSAWR